MKFRTQGLQLLTLVRRHRTCALDSSTQDVGRYDLECTPPTQVPSNQRPNFPGWSNAERPGTVVPYAQIQVNEAPALYTDPQKSNSYSFHNPRAKHKGRKPKDRSETVARQLLTCLCICP
ncbi:hypothetical protein GN244_ATG01502 [Phytophthora infestans]|uniref:Uncharacterized protein n=1 Tax=Phytophthora infestans TaxID=4787 RepID=A0A833TLK3_PHYIN|nr:hypothetical protein GN244_ATG01502 [Phytophthora infestans]